MAVPFRYNVGANQAMKTSCFKPNAVAPSFDPEKHKTSTLGAVYVGQMNRIPKQDQNKKIGLVVVVVVGVVVSNKCHRDGFVVGAQATNMCAI